MFQKGTAGKTPTQALDGACWLQAKCKGSGSQRCSPVRSYCVPGKQSIPTSVALLLPKARAGINDNSVGVMLSSCSPWLWSVPIPNIFQSGSHSKEAALP